jgi:hypothetical protein
VILPLCGAENSAVDKVIAMMTTVRVMKVKTIIYSFLRSAIVADCAGVASLLGEVGSNRAIALSRGGLLHLRFDRFGERSKNMPPRVGGRDQPRAGARICARRIPGQIEAAAEESLPL